MKIITISDILKFEEAADNFITIKNTETQEDKFFRLMLPTVIKLRNRGASILQIKDMLKETMGVDIHRNTISNYYSRFVYKKYNEKYQKLVIIKNAPPLEINFGFITCDAGFDITILNTETANYAITEKDLYALQPFSRLLAKRYMYWYYLRDSELLQGMDTTLLESLESKIHNIENIFRHDYQTNYNLICGKSRHLFSYNVS
jgi:hypothetical protein